MDGVIGTKRAGRRVAFWRKVLLKTGDNRIIVQSRQNDTTYEDRIVWRLEP